MNVGWQVFICFIIFLMIVAISAYVAEQQKIVNCIEAYKIGMLLVNCGVKP